MPKAYSFSDEQIVELESAKKKNKARCKINCPKKGKRVPLRTKPVIL